MHDLVIHDALLLDGRGSAPARGDLALTGDRISAVGKVAGPAKSSIDAAGLALMPGIIDNHTHYDAQITWDPGVSPSPRLGVTTAVIGNCGFTIAPCRSRDRELVMRNLTQVEGMSLEVLRQGIRWQFETIPEYLDLLERQGAAVNIAAFAGHEFKLREVAILYVVLIIFSLLVFVKGLTLPFPICPAFIENCPIR